VDRVVTPLVFSSDYNQPSDLSGGKPITPTEERTIGNGSAQHADDNCNGGAAIGESVTRSNVSWIEINDPYTFSYI